MITIVETDRAWMVCRDGQTLPYGYLKSCYSREEAETEAAGRDWSGWKAY